MPPNNRIFHRGEKPHHVFSNNKGSAANNKYFYIKIGVVKEIDMDKYEMTIEWTHQTGVRSKIPISFPYVGPAGCMGMVPEVGAIGIFGFYDEGGGKGSPLCLAYVSSGLANALEYNDVQVKPDSISTDDTNIIQHKFRKITSGEMILSSPSGGQILVSKGIQLLDSLQDGIIIRDEDQSIIATSLNNFIFADGASVMAGPIIRNGLMLYDLKGNKLPGLNGSSISMPGGRENTYIIPFGDPVLYDSQFYTEYRVDVDEKGDGKLDLNDINSNQGISNRRPIVSMVMGNFVGNNKTDQSYGKILRPQIFLRPDDAVGSFQLVSCIQTNATDEPAVLGLAHALNFSSGAFLGIDKEGHYFINLPSSISNPLGAGRSMSIAAAGSLKESWGASNGNNNSWDLNATGGIKWNVGAHNLNQFRRSIDITTSSSISINVTGADDNGTAKEESYFGNALETVVGSKTTDIAEKYSLTIKGMKVENIYGSAAEAVQVDKTVSVTGVYSEIVVKEKQQKYGKRKTTITVGNDELTLLAGNILETIVTFGNRTSTITTGNNTEIIGTGNKTTTIATGNFTVAIGAGNVSVVTAAGVISMTATGTINITSASMVNLTAPMVNMGGVPIGAVMAGLPGVPSDFCKISGMPFRGSMTVKTAL